MTKKILALVLVLATLLCVTACVAQPDTTSTQQPGTSGNPNDQTTGNPNDQTTGTQDPNATGGGNLKPEVPFPAAETAYYYGMIQGNKDNAVYYLAGGMAQTYYLDTTTDAAASLKIYLEETDGGYYLYCKIGDTKNYINMSVNGTHVNANYETEAKTVYTYKAENNILVSDVNGEAYTLGTKNDGSYTTVGPVAVSKNGFWCKLYTDDTLPAAPEKPDLPAFDTTLTVKQLLELPIGDEETTSGRYYVRVTIDSVTDARYGAMTVSDATGTISVYNSKNADGTVDYPNMEDQPVKGDEVLLYVNVKNYKGTRELNSAYIQEIKHNKIDDSKYASMTIAEARNQEIGTLIKVEGVVAQIAYASGLKPCGVVLVDGTSSIYVYSADLAGSVSVGNKVTIAATKAMWILESEQDNAAKHGYKGCNQLEDAYLLSNDKGNNAYDRSWIEEKTVKEIIENPVSNDITSIIYKVTAKITRSDGSGFTNYYIDDLDGKTGSYVYTQSNGNDLSWLEPYNGKICTVYMIVQNCKSQSAGCTYRFLPISVEDNFDPSSVDVPKFVVEYHALDQFLSLYDGNPELELVTSVSSELLGFENAAVRYASSDSSVISVDNGVMNCLKTGKATITITASYNGKEYSKDVTVEVNLDSEIEAITVDEAIAAELGQTVTVIGVVGPSLVNQYGFYLMSDTAMIAVTVNDRSVLPTLKLGQTVVLTGVRFRKVGEGKTCFGQTQIKDAEILQNRYGKSVYNDSYFTEITVADFVARSAEEDFTTTPHYVKATVTFGRNTPALVDGDASVTVYASGNSQYAWLRDYEGQEVILEIVACNWNSKDVKVCVLAVRTADGKVYNTLNFDN